LTELDPGRYLWAMTNLRGILGALLVATVALVARPATADLVCQYRGEITAWKFGAKKLKCIAACQRAALNGGNAADCVEPFGGKTLGCIQGAAGKAQGAICHACAADLPACWGAATCPDAADAKLGAVEGDIDTQAADVFCDDSGSPDGLTPAEIRCRDTLAKVLASFDYKKARCLARCHVIAPGQCTPPISDPTTQHCILSLVGKSLGSIDKACSPALGGDAPECHGGKAAIDWVNDAENAVDGLDPGFFCGSPSGAFVD
jgi:hypothetical protein